MHKKGTWENLYYFDKELSSDNDDNNGNGVRNTWIYWYFLDVRIRRQRRRGEGKGTGLGDIYGCTMYVDGVYSIIYTFGGHFYHHLHLLHAVLTPSSACGICVTDIPIICMRVIVTYRTLMNLQRNPLCRATKSTWTSAVLWWVVSLLVALHPFWLAALDPFLPPPCSPFAFSILYTPFVHLRRGCRSPHSSRFQCCSSLYPSSPLLLAQSPHNHFVLTNHSHLTHYKTYSYSYSWFIICT